MKVYIASDHGGFEVKKSIVESLQDKYEVLDLGPFELDPEDDYPDYAIKVAEQIVANSESRGILICRSGNGMCIAANKVKGVYASLAFSVEHAKKAVEDDNSNVICLDADYEGENVVEITKAFLESRFAGMETRHGRRFRKILDIENS